GQRCRPTSRVARRRVRQPGTDTQGAIPPERVGMWPYEAATKCPRVSLRLRLGPATGCPPRQAEDHASETTPRRSGMTPPVPERPIDPRQPPAPTGAWHEGDPVGHRRFATIVSGRPFYLEGGG